MLLSLQADTDEILTLNIGDGIEFTSGGHVVESTLCLTMKIVYLTTRRYYSCKELQVERNATTTTVSIKPESTSFQIGSINVAVVKWEHVLLFKNKTEFNKSFDNITNHWRLKLEFVKP